MLTVCSRWVWLCRNLAEIFTPFIGFLSACCQIPHTGLFNMKTSMTIRRSSRQLRLLEAELQTDEAYHDVS